jgi:hypothetical protein
MNFIDDELEPIGFVVDRVLASWGWPRHEALWGREARRGRGHTRAPELLSSATPNPKRPQREARHPYFHRLRKGHAT